MPEIIVFMSPKGGSGASFACAGVWYSLLSKSVKVLAVDACFDKCTLDYALGFQSDYVYTASDVSEGALDFAETLCAHGSGSFLRFDYENTDFDVDAAMDSIRASDFEYVLIDIGEQYPDVTFNVLNYADKLIYVTEPTLLSATMCDRAVAKYNFENSYILVNKIIPTYIKGKIHLTIDEILDMASCPLAGLLPWSPAVEIMLKQGLKFGMEDALLEKAFSNIAERITGNHVCACDFKKVYDCFKLGRNFEVMSD